MLGEHRRPRRAFRQTRRGGASRATALAVVAILVTGVAYALPGIVLPRLF